MVFENLWKSCLEGLAEHVSPQHFATWFRPIKVLGGSDDVIELEVPNRFFLEWIKEHYQLLILEVLRRISSKEMTLTWTIAKTTAAEPPTKKSTKSGTKRLSAKTKPDKSKDVEALAKEIGLNSKYTFDNFVIGPANEFAHAACSAVAKNLASKYNPLFIYGGVGLGKTHLLQAIGHGALKLNPSIKICYYSSERFMNDFINYVSRQKMSDFRGKFRNVDLLLIDDIQFWAGKERTQEEFFHTFNVLHENHKQIIVTSDKFPKDIAGIEERLRSRFEWGLVADIQPPDTETRIAILKRKALAEGIEMPNDVAAWLASISNSNVRELEGFLNRVIAVSSLTNQEISLEMSKKALKNLLKKKEDRIITIVEIQRAVSTYYNVKTSDLKSKRRHKSIAFPRQVAMYIARESGSFSYPEIGSAFGGKDHSTAIHAFKKIDTSAKENGELFRSIQQIKKDLGVN
ncbi:MAG: chromosomal replication initiator protein DnaA [Proteobacteria bacterium]|nr:chromosomal replication initiator protein DnaA [Pseudomonadota bacterium]